MAALNLEGDLTRLLCDLVDIESVSGNEERIADEVEGALRPYPHLEVIRDGNVVIARTAANRPGRVVLAGHLDTVPVARNLPSWTTGEGANTLVWGRGSCDMKGGLAVQLTVAAQVSDPRRNLTWIFYDNEEVAEHRNGLNRIAREHPEWLAADFAVLGEPSNAGIEGGCQGTLRARITLTGVAAHSARAWMGRNAIHEAGQVLDRLVAYEPQQVEVDGLFYREGLNAVGINGGIAGNIIPDRCTIDVNYRFAPNKSVEAAADHVRRVFAGYDVSIVDAAAGARPGLDQPVASEFVSAVGAEPTAKFGWTDVARFSALGIPAVNFGPGDPSKAHADDEFCPAAELVSCRDALLRWVA
jgi:succinyl-diaminopimelate desuccinylase